MVTSVATFMAVRATPLRGPLTAEPLPPLLPRVAQGDAGAVKECLRRYGRLVYSIAWRWLKNERDAEDACQEIFVALWRSAASFDASRGEETTFVALIARRRLIDRQRARGNRPMPIIEEEPQVSAAVLERHVDARTAVKALSECNDEQRRVITLALVEGLTHDEISRTLEIPLGTVKSHYSRGIERIKRALRTAEERS